MARNPTWERDEVILALDLYLQFGRLDQTSPQVVELSHVLQQLPLHPVAVRQENFRNPAGVALKIENIRALDPAHAAAGAGMPRGGRHDREIWNEYAHQPKELHRLAQAIRANPDALSGSVVEEDDDEGFLEGRVLERRHKSRERNKSLIAKKLKHMQAKGQPLVCEACSFDFQKAYGPLGAGFIEFHHRRPLSETGETKTRLQDLAPLCANCHRMIHRTKPLATVEQFKAMLQPHG